jgi:hypothetical protein
MDCSLYPRPSLPLSQLFGSFEIMSTSLVERPAMIGLKINFPNHKIKVGQVILRSPEWTDYGGNESVYKRESEEESQKFRGRRDPFTKYPVEGTWSSNSKSEEYHVVATGDWISGLIQSHGTYTWERDGRSTTYVGEFVDGMAHGHGAYLQRHGVMSYVGEFHEGNFHGLGIVADDGVNYITRWDKGELTEMVKSENEIFEKMAKMVSDEETAVQKIVGVLEEMRADYRGVLGKMDQVVDEETKTVLRINNLSQGVEGIRVILEDIPKIVVSGQTAIHGIHELTREIKGLHHVLDDMPKIVGSSQTAVKGINGLSGEVRDMRVKLLGGIDKSIGTGEKAVAEIKKAKTDYLKETRKGQDAILERMDKIADSEAKAIQVFKTDVKEIRRDLNNVLNNVDELLDNEETAAHGRVGMTNRTMETMRNSWDKIGNEMENLAHTLSHMTRKDNRLGRESNSTDLGRFNRPDGGSIPTRRAPDRRPVWR